MLMFGDGGTLNKLGDYFFLILLFSLVLSLFIRKQIKKIVYTFCLFLFAWYIILAIIFNFYFDLHENENKNKFWRSSDGRMLLLIMLVIPPLILVWWWFTRDKKNKHK